MDAREFICTLVEYLHENADNDVMLETLSMFFTYGWGEDERKVEFIQFLCEYGASYEAIKAVIRVLDE